MLQLQLWEDNDHQTVDHRRRMAVIITSLVLISYHLCAPVSFLIVVCIISYPKQSLLWFIGAWTVFFKSRLLTLRLHYGTGHNNNIVAHQQCTYCTCSGAYVNCVHWSLFPIAHQQCTCGTKCICELRMFINVCSVSSYSSHMYSHTLM